MRLKNFSKKVKIQTVLFFLGLVILAFAALGQKYFADIFIPTPINQYNLSGQIFSQNYKQPIPYAFLTLFSSKKGPTFGSKTIATNNEGKFELKNIDKSYSYIQIKKPNYNEMDGFIVNHSVSNAKLNLALSLGAGRESYQIVPVEAGKANTFGLAQIPQNNSVSSLKLITPQDNTYKEEVIPDKITNKDFTSGVLQNSSFNPINPIRLSTVGQMPQEFKNAAAAYFPPTNKYYIFSGNSVYQYDQNNPNEVKEVAQLPYEAKSLGSVYIPSKEYIILMGSVEGAGQFFIYEPAQNKVYTVGDLDDKEKYTAILGKENIYILGEAETTTAIYTLSTNNLPDLSAPNPTVDSARLLTLIPRRGMAAQYLNDKLYFFGGLSDDGVPLESILELASGQTETQVSDAKLPYPVANALSYSANYANNLKRIYLVGGGALNKIIALSFADNKISLFNTLTRLQFPDNITQFASAADSSNNLFVFSKNILRFSDQFLFSQGQVYSIQPTQNYSLLFKTTPDSTKIKNYNFSKPSTNFSFTLPYTIPVALNNQNINITTATDQKYTLAQAISSGLIYALSLNGTPYTLPTDPNTATAADLSFGSTISVTSNQPIKSITIDTTSTNNGQVEINSEDNIHCEDNSVVIFWEIRPNLDSNIEIGQNLDFSDSKIYEPAVRNENFNLKSIEYLEPLEQYYYRIIYEKPDGSFGYSQTYTIQMNCSSKIIEGPDVLDVSLDRATVRWETENQTSYIFNLYEVDPETKKPNLDLANSTVENNPLSSIYNEHLIMLTAGGWYQFEIYVFYPGKAKQWDWLTDEASGQFTLPCDIPAIANIQITTTSTTAEITYNRLNDPITDLTLIYMPKTDSFSLENESLSTESLSMSAQKAVLQNLLPNTEYEYKVFSSELCPPQTGGTFKTKAQDLNIQISQYDDQNMFAVTLQNPNGELPEKPSLTFFNSKDNSEIAVIEQSNQKTAPDAWKIVEALDESLCKKIVGDEKSHSFNLKYLTKDAEENDISGQKDFELALKQTCVKTITLKDTIFDYEKKTATLNWSTDIPAKSVFKYGETTTYNKLIGQNELKKDQSVTLSLDKGEIEKGKQYHFQIDAYSFDSKYIEKTTDDDTFTFIDIKNIKTENITQTSADIKWDTTPNTTNTLRYSTNADCLNSEPKCLNATIEPAESAASFTAKLKDLTSQTKYYFWIKSQSEDDSKMETSKQEFTTSAPPTPTPTPPTSPPPPPPPDEDKLALSNYNLTVGAVAAKLEFDTNITASGTLVVRKNLYGSPILEIPITSNTHHSIQMDRLWENTKHYYSFYLEGQNPANNLSINNVDFTTREVVKTIQSDLNCGWDCFKQDNVHVAVTLNASPGNWSAAYIYCDPWRKNCEILGSGSTDTNSFGESTINFTYNYSAYKPPKLGITDPYGRKKYDTLWSCDIEPIDQNPPSIYSCRLPSPSNAVAVSQTFNDGVNTVSYSNEGKIIYSSRDQIKAIIEYKTLGKKESPVSLINDKKDLKNSLYTYTAILPNLKSRTYYFRVVTTDDKGVKRYSQYYTLKHGHWFARFFNDLFGNLFSIFKRR